MLRVDSSSCHRKSFWWQYMQEAQLHKEIKLVKGGAFYWYFPDNCDYFSLVWHQSLMRANFFGVSCGAEVNVSLTNVLPFYIHFRFSDLILNGHHFLTSRIAGWKCWFPSYVCYMMWHASDLIWKSMFAEVTINFTRSYAGAVKLSMWNTNFSEL